MKQRYIVELEVHKGRSGSAMDEFCAYIKDRILRGVDPGAKKPSAKMRLPPDGLSDVNTVTVKPFLNYDTEPFDYDLCMDRDRRAIDEYGREVEIVGKTMNGHIVGVHVHTGSPVAYHSGFNGLRMPKR